MHEHLSFLGSAQAYQYTLCYFDFEQNDYKASFSFPFPFFYFWPTFRMNQDHCSISFAFYDFKLQHILNALFLLKYIAGVYITGKVRFMNLIYR